MRSARNPFSPGSGLPPPALVGRDADLAAFDVLVDRAGWGRTTRGIMLSGLRGTGKTVLLNSMRDRAEQAGWFVVTIEARPDEAGASAVRRGLARDIAAQARRLGVGGKASARVKAALGTITSFNAKVGTGGINLGVEMTPGRADSGDIEVDLPELVADLAPALAEKESAFALFIDEVQDLDTTLLQALLVTQHQAGQRQWPFFLLGAGLPHLPGVLAEVRSYAERLFDFRTVSRLDDADASGALRAPISAQDADIDDAALEILLASAGGYPYFLQEFGAAAWDVALGPVIDEEDARAAVEVGLERLDGGFFLARWKRATRSERRVLVAMAEDREGPSSSSEVSARMGLSPNSLGPYRAKLISKGLVYAPEHGKLAYTVPGMADYVHRHREDA